MVGRIWIRDGPWVDNHLFKRSLLSLSLIRFLAPPSEPTTSVYESDALSIRPRLPTKED